MLSCPSRIHYRYSSVKASSGGRLLMSDRRSLWAGQRKWKLQSTLKGSTYSFVSPRRPPGGCIPQRGVSRPGWRRTSAFPFALGTIPSGPSDTTLANAPRHSLRLLGGHSSCCAESSMGRMDCFGFYNSDHRFGRGHLYHEKDACCAQSSQKKDCGECRNEWGEFLRQADQ